MSSEIRCGDVDGRKRACCFLEEYGCNVTLRYPRDVTGIADFTNKPYDSALGIDGGTPADCHKSGEG